MSIEKIKRTARQKSKPVNVSSSDWANAMNWNIEAWKCYFDGQKWVHQFEVCCPEQYYMLIDKKGKFILPLSQVCFSENELNKLWLKRLESQIMDMQEKGEWNEALQWRKLYNRIQKFQLPTPNEDHFKKSKKTIKGHRLIRINVAA
jgi:hypothetical protein